MLKSAKKITAVIIIILMLLLTSCADDTRTAFSPDSGSYEVMLRESSWFRMEGQSIWDLWLFNTDLNIWVRIDYYSKSYMLSDFNVSDFDGFIRFYRTLDSAMEAYEGEYRRVYDLLDMDSSDIRGSAAISGKSQQIAISNPEFPEYNSISEFIFLETENFYFAISYGALTDRFEEAQAVVNDLIRNLRMRE